MPNMNRPSEHLNIKKPMGGLTKSNSPQLSDFDLYLFSEGNHFQIYEKLGAHCCVLDGIRGVLFAVWAPNAQHISVVGDFNLWNENSNSMQKNSSGIWECFIPLLDVGEKYKYSVKGADGEVRLKTDPYGFMQELRPKTASIVTDINSYEWHDEEWMEKRRASNPLTKPMSVYEVHLGSWMHSSINNPPLDALGNTLPDVQPANDYKQGARLLTYRELAAKLIPYVKEMGYTHLELLPVAEYPFDGSWGYQVIGYFACTSRFGTPQDFMFFVDECHKNNIGIIIDWVPGHFPRDGHGLASFDGTHLYEHPDSRRGEMKQWGTLVFDYGRNEVRNFLIANALFWLDKYHIDGLRVDAVAYMIYHDYCRSPGDWYPNQYGGTENLEAIEFLQQTNNVIQSHFPGVVTIAEDSSAWPGVTSTARKGGLGFSLKWNMGWMHDMLDYFEFDPIHRKFHHNNITFSIWYAFSENFMLSLSHDEVVHGKSNLIGKMPGDDWLKFANLRCLFGLMFTHPGKKTMFMGMEFAQWREWNEYGDLDWFLLQYDRHKQMQNLVKDLNSMYTREEALFSQDFTNKGFDWIDCHNNEQSIIAFIRRAGEPSHEYLVIIINFTPITRSNYRVGVPEHGFYKEIFNSDAACYGGTNTGNLGGKWSQEWQSHSFNHSLELNIPPLSTIVMKIQR